MDPGERRSCARRAPPISELLEPPERGLEVVAGTSQSTAREVQRAGSCQGLGLDGLETGVLGQAYRLPVVLCGRVRAPGGP